MFDSREPSLSSYFKLLNLTNRFGKVTETTIDKVHSRSSVLRESLVVLSWNIAKNNLSRQWSRDFLAIIEQYRPDKIFLQEVRLCALEREIPQLASMGWSFAPNLIDTSDNTYSGVLTATKANRLSSKMKITRHYEPLTKTPKVSLFVEYALGHGYSNLLTVNTHLINFVETSKFQTQLQEIETIIAEHEGAVLFSGDFNTWNRTRWLLLCQMTDKLGLTPVTFSAIEARKLKRFLFSPPLDYIFYRGFRQKTTSAKVIDNIYSSDHNPLLVELELK